MAENKEQMRQRMQDEIDALQLELNSAQNTIGKTKAYLSADEAIPDDLDLKGEGQLIFLINERFEKINTDVDNAKGQDPEAEALEVSLQQQLEDKQDKIELLEIFIEQHNLAGELVPIDKNDNVFPIPEWRTVIGSHDEKGKLEAFSIGNMNRNGVVMRYVNNEGDVLMVSPYQHAKMIKESDTTVSLNFAG